MFAELKNIKNNPGKHSAISFFLWNCSLPECSRTVSLHCNPSLWGKNQLSRIRARFSEDKLPGMGAGTSLTPLQKSPCSLHHPSLSQPELTQVQPTIYHPSTGSGSPGKAYKSLTHNVGNIPLYTKPWSNSTASMYSSHPLAHISKTAGPKSHLLVRKICFKK